MTEGEYRTAWMEAEYIIAGWWIEKPIELVYEDAFESAV